MLQILGRFQRVFTDEQESMLVEYIRKLDGIFYGLQRKELAELAFEFAEANKVAHPFSKGQAGEQWMQNFMARHKELALRTPESTSIARARGFNREQVGLFFNNLKDVMDKHQFDKSMIWNVDETGKFKITSFDPDLEENIFNFVTFYARNQNVCQSATEGV